MQSQSGANVSIYIFLSKIHINFEVQLCLTLRLHISKLKNINPVRLLHIKYIFKEYLGILGFIIFSLNKSLKMSITQLKKNLNI